MRADSLSRRSLALRRVLPLAALAAAAGSAPARAEAPAEPSDPGPRPGASDASGASDAHPVGRSLHGSIAVGGALLLTGDRGDRTRAELSADLKLRSRYGVLVAWRAPDEHHRGLVTAGLTFEAGAARPRLVIDLHADLGADLDARAPLAGGGIRTTLGLAGAAGLILDAGGYLVLDGVAETRLQLQSSALLALRW